MYISSNSGKELKRKLEDAEFAIKIKLLIALTFVPPKNLVETFEFLCENNLLPEEAHPVLDYFEDTWIGQLQLYRRRRLPRFPHLLGNCFSKVLKKIYQS